MAALSSQAGRRAGPLLELFASQGLDLAAGRIVAGVSHLDFFPIPSPQALALVGQRGVPVTAGGHIASFLSSPCSSNPIRSRFRASSTFRKFNILGFGACAILLCQDSSSKVPPPPPPPGNGSANGNEKKPGNDKDPEDRFEAILRLLKKILEDMPSKEVKEPGWIVKKLQQLFGEADAASIVSVANFVKNEWRRCYVFYLSAYAWIRLEINPVKGFKIVKYYLKEQQDGAHDVLAAYARKTANQDEEDHSVSAVALTVVNLETNQMDQIQLYMRGEGAAAVLSLLANWSLSQPPVKEGLELNQIHLFLTNEDSAALLNLLQTLANAKDSSGKKDEPSSPV